MTALNIATGKALVLKKQKKRENLRKHGIESVWRIEVEVKEIALGNFGGVGWFWIDLVRPGSVALQKGRGKIDDTIERKSTLRPNVGLAKGTSTECLKFWVVDLLR